MRDIDRRFPLFCDYINELQTIKGLKPFGSIELHSLYQSYLAEQCLQWIDIFDKEDGVSPVGFFIVGYPPNCHPDADFYIEEAYTAPFYRRRGLMSSCVSAFIKAHPGIYCLFILKRNKIALRFWNKVFTQCGYVPYFLSDVGAGDVYCRQYGFRKLV